MVILGIDPGTTMVGYGVLLKNKGKLSLLEYGVIRSSSKNSSERIFEISRALSVLIKKHKPDIAGIETLFFSTNKKTALAVSEARGAIILTLRQNRVPIIEFTPNNIKAVVTGYGRSDKYSIKKVVSLNLGIGNSKLPDDAFDALAIAMRTSFSA